MKEIVYIDSTIPSYYFDERESLKSFSEVTRRWWKEEFDRFEIWLSEAVLQELGEGEYPNKREILAFVKDIPLLDRANDIEVIANIYMTNYVMPSNFVGDAIHLAYASFYQLNYLLTWNCKHLANASKRRHIQIINGKLGLSTPQIITPLELFLED